MFELRPLSQSILVGYQWATAHGVQHNHNNLFEWAERTYDDDGNVNVGDIRLESACAVGFGWIGNMLLSGMAEDEVIKEIYFMQECSIPDYDTFVAETKAEHECPCEYCGSDFGTASGMVVHLNDNHGWTIEQIVEYLLNLEPEETRLELARTIEIPTERAGPTLIQQVIDELGLTQAEVNLLS
jgi:hypothetical protein